MFEINIWLFGKPAWEMEIEGVEINPDLLRIKAIELKERLETAADIIEKLQLAGYEVTGCLYDAVCSIDMKEEDDIRDFLSGLDISLDDVSLYEMSEFDEDFEDENLGDV